MQNSLTKDILNESFNLNVGLGCKVEIMKGLETLAQTSTGISIMEVTDHIQAKIALEVIVKKQMKRQATNPVIENLRAAYREKMFDLLKFGRGEAA